MAALDCNHEIRFTTQSVVKPRNRVTSAQVAERAEVSQSAVSRTFTPGASVAPETRERVLQAARDLGYRPNAIARSLISGRSRMIGLLVAYLDNQFYPIVLELLGRALQQRGYQTLLFITDAGDQDLSVERLLQYQVDGVVLASATMSNELAQECIDAAIPVVLFNRYVASALSSSVTCDNLAGGRHVADHLLDRGRRRLAYIAGHEDSSTNQERERGFSERLTERGRTLHARAVGGYTTEGAVTATLQLMDLDEPPDALFVANDHMAFAVMDTLRNTLGLSIPGDVSVVGFDDTPQAAWPAYSLTSVSQSAEQMIDATVRLLMDQIENREANPQTLRLPVELMVRASS